MNTRTAVSELLAVSISIAVPSMAAQDPNQTHEALFLEDRFPSATTCRTCHPEQFEEWSVSSHAYAQLSPVFHAMHGTILQLTNGTNGDFCIRCHNPIGMNLGEELYISNMDRHPTSREGITCIACHRMSNSYGKVSGRVALDKGTLLDLVNGPTGVWHRMQKSPLEPLVSRTTAPWKALKIGLICA